MNKYFIELYSSGNTKNLSEAKKEIKKIIKREYFSINKKYPNNKINFTSRIKKLKVRTTTLRHPFSRTLFLNEPKLYSESFYLPKYLTSFITSQRFIYVFNRSIGESFVYLRNRLLNLNYTRGLWLGDMCWEEKFGSRSNAIGIENLNIKPFINDKNRNNLNAKDLRIIKKSWDNLEKLKNIQPIVKSKSEYSARVNAKSFSFGIPGLNYEKADLGKSTNALLDYELMNQIRKMTKKNNTKLILTRLPRLYDRYPTEIELKKIREFYPDISSAEYLFEKPLNMAEAIFREKGIYI